MEVLQRPHLAEAPRLDLPGRPRLLATKELASTRSAGQASAQAASQGHGWPRREQLHPWDPHVPYLSPLSVKLVWAVSRVCW